MAHILVVDDEPAMLQLIRRILQKDQHLLTLISDTSKVLNMNFSKYDLILLDIMMLGLNGFELCRQIRSHVDCPIIFLTAKIQEADIVRGLGLGADGKEKLFFYFRYCVPAQCQGSKGTGAKTSSNQK